MAALIRATNISKVYHKTAVPVHAINNLSVDIAEGEFTAIVGPSGCGKTTLLNILGGLDYPTSGTVTINGIDISGMKDSERIDFRLHNIGFVFHAYNLIPVLTALENVEFIMLLQKRSRKERLARARELLEQMNIADKADHRPGELSGGQQQRVAVARAIVTDPTVIVADEPTGDLDRVSAADVLDLMDRLVRDYGKTVVMVTHDPRAAERARRVRHLEKGVM